MVSDISCVSWARRRGFVGPCTFWWQCQMTNSSPTSESKEGFRSALLGHGSGRRLDLVAKSEALASSPNPTIVRGALASRTSARSLTDQDEVKETSQVVFDSIHAYWSTLPEDERPEVYFYGLSLGSLGVESILTPINIINEPTNGALMVGPPFTNKLSRRSDWSLALTADRMPESVYTLWPQHDHFSWMISDAAADVVSATARGF